MATFKDYLWKAFKDYLWKAFKVCRFHCRVPVVVDFADTHLSQKRKISRNRSCLFIWGPVSFLIKKKAKIS